MGAYPRYQDSLSHEHYGKSKLPLFVVLSNLERSYPLHYHNFAELSMVIEGTGTEIVGGTPHVFREGTVTFLLPHHIHEIRLSSPKALKYNIMFDLNMLFLSPSDRELANALLKTGLDYPTHYDLNEEQRAHMTSIFQAMRQEYENEGFGKDSVLRSKLLEAFVFLLRIPRSLDSMKPAVARSETRSSMVENIVQYLHVHYQDEITLGGLASRFNTNASYLSRIFKQFAGQTFTEYLHSLRVGRAASLLATTSMSVTEIAIDVGFDQTRTFTRAFKDVKGTTPKMYRARFRNAASEYV
ncbi:AraC family transcriptional regulator [Paenibacillus ginsengarvi]|uniref:AraC family transcriptional regulator n=1 Tax=Paenibacillus ginsengarvi TaxID=400777 RepID=A0A3B0BGT2_9BACL|nr:AraC family transcriptional regulator [Paenibacillus ginsengarvi]RKN71900.1 AraC family transcriptional regulator [Paenibacillus ginsengarvi]